ncbi:MAG: hypothetical protein LRZ85_09180 [Alphaproteobacteria bacterium]|nr:hypothetical protein [Alphaproteobacteria bacterium]
MDDSWSIKQIFDAWWRKKAGLVPNDYRALYIPDPDLRTGHRRDMVKMCHFYARELEGIATLDLSLPLEMNDNPARPYRIYKITFFPRDEKAFLEKMRAMQHPSNPEYVPEDPHAHPEFYL